MFNNLQKVYVIDEIMGRGKTTAMIRHINEAPDDERFLFITPLLTETERITQSCPEREFYEPEAEGGKLNHIKEAITQNRNISSTHALFSMLDDEAIELLRAADYTLVIDEVPCAITMMDITPSDAKNINANHTDTLDDGRIIWTDTMYDGRYNSYRESIERGYVFKYNDANFVTVMPLELFTAFNKVYIMTYMFEHQIQRCYFDLHGIKYDRLYVGGTSQDDFHIVNEPVALPPMPYDKLIHICENKKMNEIGNGFYSLSKNFYVKRIKKGSPDTERLRKNCMNYVRNICKAKSIDVLWTTFKQDEMHNIDWQALLGSKGYSTRFLSCTAKGTNDYRNCYVLMYLINRFANASIYNFLHSHGVNLDQDMFALSEMLQWIWRSAIRDGKEVWIYVPSERMRALLENWIKEVSRNREADSL